MSKEKDKYVWYVAYGSNLSHLRLIHQFDEDFCYEPYAVKISEYQFENKPFKIWHPIYFANKAGYSSKWGNTGVAFLDDQSPGFAFGRAYKMPKYLFEYLRDREGRSDNWYNKVVHLGEMEDGIEIVTLTNKNRFDCLKPCEAYLDKIRIGLHELGLNREESDKYLEFVMGNHNYSKDKTKTSHIVIKTYSIDTPNGKKLRDIHDLLTVAELDRSTFYSLWSLFEERGYQKPETWMLLMLNPETRSDVMMLAIENKDLTEDELLKKAFEIINKN